MKKVPIISTYSIRHGSAGESSGKAYCLSRPLPLFYMSDYSVLGLLVDSTEKASQVLREYEYPVTEEPYGIDVEIGETARLQDIVRLLAEHSLRVEMTDVIDQIYQG